MRRLLLAVVLVSSVLGLAVVLDTAGATHSPNGLRRSLQGLVARLPLVAPRALAVPKLRNVPQACEVGLPRCSLTPCVEFATASSAVRLSTVTVMGPGLAPRSAPRCRPGGPSRSLPVAVTTP